MSLVLRESLVAWWPETILSLGALAVILLSAFWPARSAATARTRPAVLVTWLTLATAAGALLATPVPPATGVFFGVIVCDPMSLVFRWLSWGTTALIVLMVMGSREIEPSLQGEVLGLLLWLSVALMLMAEANHLLMAYLAVESVSLTSYLLVGLLKTARSAEASLKYVLFGAFSSGIMLFGMSLLFGATRALAFSELPRALTLLPPSTAPSVLVALVFIVAGLAFKVSMAPFHMWTPDVYEGAPMAVTALLSVGPKAAGLALLLRVLTAVAPAWPMVQPILLTLTILTMTLGNFAALAQTNIKRLLAYSTIGQAGYLLIGIAAQTRFGLEALLVYLVAYLFMNLGAFACVAAVVQEGGGDESLEGFRGLARRAPGMALMGALFFLSLSGLPPLVGFIGKFLLFGAALHAHQLALAIAGIVNSAVALAYYVNLIRLMYLAPPQALGPIRPAGSLRLVMGLCAAATMWLGLFPSSLLAMIHAGSVLSLV